MAYKSQAPTRDANIVNCNVYSLFSQSLKQLNVI